MNTETSTPPDDQNEARFSAVVQDFADILGRKLTAYLGSAKGNEDLNDWLRGGPAPDGFERRVRLGLQIANQLRKREGRGVVQLWFTGANPDLEYRAPIDFLRDRDAEQALEPLTMAVNRYLSR